MPELIAKDLVPTLKILIKLETDFDKIKAMFLEFNHPNIIVKNMKS